MLVVFFDSILKSVPFKKSQNFSNFKLQTSNFSPYLCRPLK